MAVQERCKCKNGKDGVRRCFRITTDGEIRICKDPRKKKKKAPTRRTPKRKTGRKVTARPTRG